MNEERLFLEIPIPSLEDLIRFEEKVKCDQEKEKGEERDKSHIIVIDI